MTFVRMDTNPELYMVLPKLVKASLNGGRWYQTPNGTFPSVTTVLSSMEEEVELTEWKKKVGEEAAERIKNIAARRGSAIHSMAEKYLLNLPMADIVFGQMPDAIGIFKLMQPQLDRIKAVYYTEAAVYSKKYRFAGTLDIAGRWDGDTMGSGSATAIIDIKGHMSDLIFAEKKIEKYFLQVAAYALALEEQTGTKTVDGILIFASNDYGVTVRSRSLFNAKYDFLKVLDTFYNKDPLLDIITTQPNDYGVK